ncbi:MAG: DUF3810 domain-containing protein [Acidimicrobiia bacterium]|nr:DUF3810 domain-containing protein [Acidimicrobiia bacterium]
MRIRIALIGAALTLAVVPISEDVVEAAYSTGVYPRLQAILTSASNVIGVALFDVLILAVIAGWSGLLWRDVRRMRGAQVLARLVWRTGTWSAALYVAFLVAWGLNYRRVPLEVKLEVRYNAVTPAAAERLTRLAVAELNRLAPRRLPTEATLRTALWPAVADVQARLGAPRAIVPGRPKRTLFDPYFRAAAVDGMTDPFFLETLTLSTLLPVEHPMVVAHEWAHLAGYADEGEANFVGWLACLRADEAARYSAWLFLYTEALGALDDATGQAVSRELGEVPRGDLVAIAQRVRGHRNPFVAAIGWGVYDQYLKANGVEQGTRSYTEVVRLVLGTSLGVDAIDAVAGATT